MRAIGVSHTACKDEFRRDLRSHSWRGIFIFYNIIRSIYLLIRFIIVIYSIFVLLPILKRKKTNMSIDLKFVKLTADVLEN